MVIVTTITTTYYASRTTVSASEIKVNNNAETDSLEELFYDMQSVPFSAIYLNEMNIIKALWDYENFTEAKCFVRYDNESSFMLYEQTNNRYTDIPVNMFLIFARGTSYCSTNCRCS